MLKLSARRVRLAYDSYWKNHGISEELHVKSLEVIVRALEGKRYSTRQEIGEEIESGGCYRGDDLVKYFLGRAEVDGIICNGVDKGNKRTYALLDERVLPMKELHKEEALAKLAIKYFRSHSPASLQDFIWWSGLSITEAKQAVGLIDAELIKERIGETDWLIHHSCARNVRAKRGYTFVALV